MSSCLKRLLPPLILALASVTASAADNAAFAGKWMVHTSIAGYESDYACAFTQKDGALTGTCTPERGSVEVSGKAEEKTAAWTYKSEYEGNPITVTFKGTLDATGKVAGSVTVEEFGVEGEFTATPSK